MRHGASASGMICGKRKTHRIKNAPEDASSSSRMFFSVSCSVSVGEKKNSHKIRTSQKKCKIIFVIHLKWAPSFMADLQRNSSIFANIATVIGVRIFVLDVRGDFSFWAFKPAHNYKRCRSPELFICISIIEGIGVVLRRGNNFNAKVSTELHGQSDVF